MKLKAYARILTALLLLVGLPACEDIIEPSLEDKQLTINSPADGYSSRTGRLTFWWDALQGAREYNVQVVRGSFSTVDELVLDTLLSGNQFTLMLDTGAYSWRISARNNNDFTQFAVRSFRVINGVTDTFDILPPPFPVYPFPGDTVAFPIKFRWSRAPAAKGDTIYVANNPSFSQALVTFVTDTSFTLSFGNSGTYYWKLRSTSGDGTNSSFAPTRSFFVP